MTKYILLVESYPSHPSKVAEFNQWYEDVHVPEVCAVEGVVNATRLAPADAAGGSYIVMYDLEGDPEQAVANIKATAGAGKFNMSDAVSMGPVPKMRILSVYSTYQPES